MSQHSQEGCLLPALLRSALPSWTSMPLPQHFQTLACPVPGSPLPPLCLWPAAAGEVAEGVQSSVLQLGLVHLPLASTRSYGGPPLSEQ